MDKFTKLAKIFGNKENVMLLAEAFFPSAEFDIEKGEYKRSYSENFDTKGLSDEAISHELQIRQKVVARCMTVMKTIVDSYEVKTKESKAKTSFK